MSTGARQHCRARAVSPVKLSITQSGPLKHAGLAYEYWSYRGKVTMDSPASEPAADAAVAAVAMLADKLRCRMYAFIRASRRPVTREQAADAAGISCKLAA